MSAKLDSKPAASTGPEVHPALDKTPAPATPAPTAKTPPAVPTPAPAQVVVATPASAATDDRPRNVSPGIMRGQKLGGSMPSLPPALRLQVNQRGGLVVSYKLCVDRSGHIQSINHQGGSPPAGTDEVISGAVRAWTYQPQQTPVCFIETFHFEVEK